MIRKFTFILLLSLSFVKGNSQEIKLVSQKRNVVTLNNSSKAFVSETKVVNEKNMEDFSKSAKVLTMEKDAPALPVFTSSVVIPNEGRISLSVTYDSFEEFEGIEVAPSKGSLKRNINPANIPYDFGKVYQEDAFYPGEIARVSNPFILRDVRGATVSFYPYQYNPVTKKLRVYKNISATVVTDESQQGINVKQNADAVLNNVFTPIYKTLFINGVNSETVAEDGEMLIISPNNYIETIAPLADWKIKKGIKTTVVPLSEMGTTADDIKEYIQGFYEENPGLTYVLLVGDHEDLPSYTYGEGSTGEELWSDSFYAQLEGDDYFPEVLVGRFSGSVNQVGLMVNRTLEYETNPAEGEWMMNAGGIGSEEGEGYGDEGQPDWEHLRGIGNQLLDYGYNYYYEFFDGSQGGNDEPSAPMAFMISNAVNDGIGLLNYCGHGDKDLFVTGFFTSDDVDNLENNGKYPFVVSVACNNGTFTQGTSICESWLRAGTGEAPAGAVASCGSSILMAWAEPMQTQDAIAELIVGDNPENVKTTLGGLFFNGQINMLESYGMSYTAIEVMQTWVFFGDPSVVYRNKQTQAILAEHAAHIDNNATQVVVECSVEGAVVAITQDGVIIGIGTIHDGQVVVTLGEFNPDDELTVTVTQQNYKPYTGIITAGALGTGTFNNDAVVIYPNPAKEFITVKLNLEDKDSTFEIRDITGKLVYVSEGMSGSSQNIDTSKYSSGIYLLTIKSGEIKETKKFIIR